MHIDKIAIKNFRLLQNVELFLDQQTTILVGRNNSGKTSLIELFRRLLSEQTPSFGLEDFSLSIYEQFWTAFNLKKNGDEAANILKALPFIDVRLTIKYEENLANVGPLSNFLIELNPTCTTALVVIRYQVREGRVNELFEDIHLEVAESEIEEKAIFFRAIKERIKKHFKTSLWAVDPNDTANEKHLDWSMLNLLIQSGFIYAQRGLDDTTHKERNTLGQVLEALFNTAMSDSAEPDDKAIVHEINQTVQNIQQDIDANFNKQLATLLPSLSLFGYPGLKDPDLQTETILDASRLLKDHTKIHYAGVNGVNLPESYNGLGIRNLILILLRLLEFFKAYKATPVAPSIHLVFIEEPEVHLHPQMQTVFIRKLREIADVFSRDYNNNNPWPVQFIVSTHSPHVANEAPFEATRYFLANPQDETGTIFTTKIKDLKYGLSDTPPGDKDFLHQYMTLTRCDLMFADKSILIEGTSERLLLPKMINKIDKNQPDGKKLSSQYVSIIEVGGAYAHIFFDLLNFLELRTLVITDLDSIDHNNNRRSCRVSEGTRTSNACIQKWFDDSAITPATLIQTGEQNKIRNFVRIAYQVPETDENPCGRSLEDAFMLANSGMFNLAENSFGDKEQGAWDRASKIKKTEFALKYAIRETTWNVPRYISEGLRWLAEGIDRSSDTDADVLENKLDEEVLND